MNFVPKVVETNHYHLWTDVLHARALAHQAPNRWDCGSYVRWTVIIGWTVLEIACQEALEDDSISYSFRRNLDKAVQQHGLQPIDWGSGTWQNVTKLQMTRKAYVHRFASVGDTFPAPAIADEAVVVVRAGVGAVHEMVGQKAPQWIEDDSDRGWAARGGSVAHAGKIWAGASADDPLAIRVSYVCDDGEYESDIMPPDADYEPVIYGLLRAINIPISRINVRRGEKLMHTMDVNMRGA